MEGFLLINKPADITSFNCVGHLRRLLGKGIKIGHGGTLDKFATGLLIMGVGRGATKHLGQLLQMPKTYVGRGKLGELTDTYDPLGIVIEHKPIDVDKDVLQEAIMSFGKGYIQVPPVYSALKFQGTRLSDLQRAERPDAIIKVVDIALAKRRYVDLYQLQLVDFSFPYFTIHTEVSGGTYVRVLINDIAKKLDSCATTIQLCRTAVGPFELTKALNLPDLSLEQVQANMVTVPELQSIIDSYMLRG